MTNPAVPAAVSLLTGVAAGVWLPVPPLAVGVVLVVVWALAVAAVSLRAGPRPVALLLVAGFTAGGLLLGATRHAAAVATPLARWFDDQPGADSGRVGPVLLEGRLREDATPTDYGAALHLTVGQIGGAGAMRAASGGVRLSVGGRRWSGRLTEWRAGRVLRIYATLRPAAAYRNPGVADQARRQAMRGTALVGSVKSGLLVEVVRRGSAPAEQAATARAAVRRVIGRSVGRYGGRSAAIVTAVLIGDRAGLDEETTRRLQEGGTYHVIAISGGNIVILAGCLVLFGRWVGLRPRRLSGAVVALLVGYAYLVGHEASVARATTAAVIVLGAGFLDHRTPPVNVLAVTATGIVLVSPLAVFDAGFLLTFGATLGIVLGAARVARTLCRLSARLVDPLPRWVAPPLTLLAATLCAEAALMPIGAAFVRPRQPGGSRPQLPRDPADDRDTAGRHGDARAGRAPPVAIERGRLRRAPRGHRHRRVDTPARPLSLAGVPRTGTGGADDRRLLRRADAAALDQGLWSCPCGRSGPAGVGGRLDRVGPVRPGAHRASTRRLDAGQLSRRGAGGRHAPADAGRTVAAGRCWWLPQPAVRHRVTRGGSCVVGAGRAAARCCSGHPWRPGSHRRYGGGVAGLRAA